MIHNLLFAFTALLELEALTTTTELERHQVRRRVVTRMPLLETKICIRHMLSASQA